jgi:hypothetical protein
MSPQYRAAGVDPEQAGRCDIQPGAEIAGGARSGLARLAVLAAGGAMWDPIRL